MITNNAILSRENHETNGEVNSQASLALNSIHKKIHQMLHLP